jgi:hypothetical protein
LALRDLARMRNAARLTRTHRSRCTSAGGPMYGLEWTMVATVGPLAFGVLLIYLVIRKG